MTLVAVSFFDFQYPATPLQAQPQPQSPYHHVGDTIYGQSPIYFYNWWSENWLADTSKRLYAGLLPDPRVHGEYLQYYYTEEPIQVIGIATTAITRYIYGEFNPTEELDVETLFPEYLRLYDASVDSFVLVKEVLYDRSVPKRYMHLDYRAPQDEYSAHQNLCCNWEHPDKSRTAIIREYYFEKPVTLTDSFYLGITIENNFDGFGHFNPNLEPDVWDHYQWYIIRVLGLYWYKSSFYSLNCNYYCDTTSFLKKYHDIYWDSHDTIQSISQWRWRHDPNFMLNFPILVVDSSYIIPPYECPSVQNFRIGSLDDDRAILLWDTHTDHDSWQISYGPAGTEPGDGTIVNCPIQVGQMTGLDTCTDYVAYIRAVCHHDSTEYSQWNGPLNVNICDTADVGLHDGVTYGLDQYIKLFPNPASESVQIVSSFEMYRVEVVDHQGRYILDIRSEGHSETLDVHEWQPGLYFAIIHTSVGNYTKKLVIR